MKLWRVEHFWTPKSEDKICPKVFNIPDFHFSEVTFFQNWYFRLHQDLWWTSANINNIYELFKTHSFTNSRNFTVFRLELMTIHILPLSIS